jgi:SAM-dependent methyltransferase
MTHPNIESWTRANAEHTDARAEEAWAREEPDWGVWRVPESELHALPDVTGKDVVELGCGTAYFGAWLKKLGAARVVGVDPTPAQLATARRCNEKFGLGLEFVEAFGEDVPLPDASFDIVFSEYGASIWADPYKWIPEAARLLRPGRRARLPPQLDARHPLLADDETLPRRETLQRPQFGMHRFQWPGEASSTTSRTATGSGCCARTASRSST